MSIYTTLVPVLFFVVVPMQPSSSSDLPVRPTQQGNLTVSGLSHEVDQRKKEKDRPWKLENSVADVDYLASEWKG